MSKGDSSGRRYEGPLAEKLPSGSQSSLMEGSEYEQEWEAFRQERLRAVLQKKLSLLFEHYAIDQNDPNAWALLAQALIFEHVPGFQFESRGRPPHRSSTKWRQAREELAQAIQDLHARRPNLSLQAYLKLAQKKLDPENPLAKKSLRTLRNEIQRYRDECTLRALIEGELKGGELAVEPIDRVIGAAIDEELEEEKRRRK
jgi:hypothetical protein